MKNPGKKIKELFKEYESQVDNNEKKTEEKSEETLWGYGVYAQSSGGCCC